MAPFEALYGNHANYRCVGWRGFVLGPNLAKEASEKIELIRERMKEARSRQKSYADKRRKDLEFSVGDKVFIKVSLTKGVVRFGKSGKLTSR